jgi:hypothetical protein
MATVSFESIPSVNHSFVQGLGRLVQQSFGGAVVLIGCAMLFTLWLIPVGLPLLLLGVAMMSDPASVR